MRYFRIGEDQAVESFEAMELADEAAAVRRAQEMLRSKPTVLSATI